MSLDRGGYGSTAEGTVAESAHITFLGDDQGLDVRARIGVISEIAEGASKGVVMTAADDAVQIPVCNNLLYSVESPVEFSVGNRAVVRTFLNCHGCFLLYR